MKSQIVYTQSCFFKSLPKSSSLWSFTLQQLASRSIPSTLTEQSGCLSLQQYLVIITKIAKSRKGTHRFQKESCTLKESAGTFGVTVLPITGVGGIAEISLRPVGPHLMMRLVR